MTPDFLDLLRALLAAEARFMIVGAYAVGVHGRPRATKDLDVWVETSAANAPKVIAALRDFGARGLSSPAHACRYLVSTPRLRRESVGRPFPSVLRVDAV
jgi:hypothetical protein